MVATVEGWILGVSWPVTIVNRGTSFSLAAVDGIAIFTIDYGGCRHGRRNEQESEERARAAEEAGTLMPEVEKTSETGVTDPSPDGPKRPPVEATVRPQPAGLTTAQLNEQLDAYSARTSANLRSLVLGVLGLAWLLLLNNPDLRAITSRISEYTLLGIAGLCVVALALDVVQYLFAESAVEDAFDRAEKSGTGMASYNQALFAYRAQLWCYKGKQIVAGMATLLLLLSLGRALV